MRLKLIIALLIIGSSAYGQSMSVNWLKQSTFTAAGTNTYTVTATGVTQYVAGLELKILFTNANTGASTINVNSLGARTLQKNGVALASGDIAAGGTYRITFDGTNFQVLGIGGSGGGGGVTAGDKGDITVTLVPENWTIDNNAVTNAKINDVAWSKITGTPTSLSGYGVTGAETLSSLRLNGTAGAGFLQWDWQSTNPAGTASRTTMWADATGRLNWRLGTGGSSFISTFDAAGITANRTYTLPDFSGTLFGQGVNTLSAPASFTGNRVSFTPNATTAGINVGTVAGNPSSLAVGDLWFNSTQNLLWTRKTGSTHYFVLSQTGGQPNRIPIFTDTDNISGNANFTYNNTTLLVGGTTPTASTTLDIRGTGTDNTTSAARFANSANIQLMRLFNGGSLLLGGTTLTNDNTVFDIQSTTQGFALPRMTDTQRNAITSPYSGLQIHSTTSNRPNWHNGTAWQEAASLSDLNGWLTGTLNAATTTIDGATNDLVFDNIDQFRVENTPFIFLGDVTTAVTVPGAVQLGGVGGSASMTSTDAAITVSTGANALTINDVRVVPKGIEYLSDYSANYTSRSLVDAGWANSRLRAKTLPAPGAGQNGQSIRWNNTTDQWEYFTAAGGATYYAPTSLVVHSSDAHYTAVANSVLYLPDGVISANRTLTIPTGANGDVLEIYCNEDTHAWNLAGATVYLADRTTVVSQLLFNVPTLMQRINGLWIIKN